MLFSGDRYFLFAWIAPIILGGLCSAYEVTLYRTFSLNPDTVPGYLGALVLMAILFGAGLAAFAFGRAVCKACHGRMKWPRAGIAGLLGFVYVFIRALIVNGALTAQLGYACCVEHLPIWQETIVRVLDPTFGYLQ